MPLDVGFRIPSALAGSDNEVEANEDGMRKVLEMVAGTALGAAILAGGALIYRKAAGALGGNKNVSDLY